MHKLSNSEITQLKKNDIIFVYQNNMFYRYYFSKIVEISNKTCYIVRNDVQDFIFEHEECELWV